MGFGEIAMLLAGGWVLFARLSGLENSGSVFRHITGERGILIARIIFGVARKLLRENWRGESVRLVGVNVSGLVKTGLSLPESLFKREEKQRRVLEVIDNIRNKYGEHAIVRAKAMR